MVKKKAKAKDNDADVFSRSKLIKVEEESEFQVESGIACVVFFKQTLLELYINQIEEQLFSQSPSVLNMVVNEET